MSDDSSGMGLQAERDARLTRLIDSVIDRRRAGDAVSDESVISDHPDLMPELAQRLSSVRLIEEAERLADDSDTQSTAWIGRGAPVVPPAADSFPGYRIEGEIQRGGQGVVYRALQLATNRPVAIKIMREGPFGDARGRVRFEREVQILAALKHPNIVTIHDSGAAAGCVYFVMDYIDGQPLDEYVRGRLTGGDRSAADKLSIAELLGLFAKICRAVNVAHLRGVIHRDLKPGNIRVDASGEPHILDFGLAKVSEHDDLASDVSQAMTLTGQIVGSLPWSSPEQAEGRHTDIDIRTDVYSLGVILYQMLTGTFPYAVVGTLRERLDAILHAEPMRPSTHSRRIDGELETIVLKCLNKDRERRYQSAGELARDIEHYLAGEAIEAKRDSALYVLRKQLRRHRGPVAVLALFVVLVFAFGVVMYFQADRNRRLAVSEHEAKQAAQTAESRARRVSEFLQTMLGSVNPAIARDQDTTLLRGLLESASERAAAELADQPEVEAAVRSTIGKTYKAIGEYEPAAEHLSAAMEIRQRVLGPGHPDTLKAQLEWAKLVHERGELAEAEKLYRECLDLGMKTLGPDDKYTISVRNKLAEVLHDQSRLDEAEPLYVAVLADAQRVLGETSEQTIAATNNLATLYYDRGEYDKAAEYLRRTLAIQRELEGDDHPDTLTLMNNLAALLKRTSKLDEAGELYRQVLETRRRVLGPEHAHTLVSMQNYARFLQTRGDLDGAEALLTEVLAVQRRVLGDEHPHTIITMYNLSGLLRDRKKFDAAEPLMTEVLALCMKVYGPEHAETIETMDHVGGFYLAKSDLERAEPLLRKAVELAPSAFHADDARIAQFRVNLGGCLTALKQYEEAEANLLAAFEQFRETLGEDHAATRMATSRLVELYEAWGQPERADAFRPLANATGE